MYRKLINLIASQPYEALTPFRVLGFTAFYFLKLEPALPVNQYCSIIGLAVDVKGTSDKLIVIDSEGDCTVLNPTADAGIIEQLYNRLQVEKLQTA